MPDGGGKKKTAKVGKSTEKWRKMEKNFEGYQANQIFPYIVVN